MRLTAVPVIVCLALMAPEALGQRASAEYDVRAEFVLNFSRYVEWPADRRTPPFQLCLFGENPFGARLEAVVTPERWQGGAIEVRVVRDVEQAAQCHLLYVPARANGRFAAVGRQLAAAPVLTVGEAERFLQDGGMIHLFVEDQNVRFAINQKAAASAGLQISSRLLRLARSVIPGSS